MAWNKEPSRIPTAIGRLVIRLSDDPASNGEPAEKLASFRLEVLNGDGEVMIERQGDLIPHLTSQERTQLIAFMNTLRARAESEILP